MSQRDWLFILAAIGLALAAIANAQPVGRDGAHQAAPNQGQAEPSNKPDPAPRFTIQDALDRVARAMEAANNQPKSADEREQAERDLAAQEGMAKWAKYMFWAAVASVALTAAGVFLIWQTLIYTRTAAIAAKDAVTEAKEATKAAILGAEAAERTVAETRRIGDAQVKSYILINEAALNWDGPNPHIMMVCKNTGQTPAPFFDVGASVKTAPLKGYADWGIIERDFEFQTWSGLGGNDELTIRYTPKNLHVYANIQHDIDAYLVITGVVRYGDVFGDIYESEFAFFTPQKSRGHARKMSRPVARLRVFQKIDTAKANDDKTT